MSISSTQLHNLRCPKHPEIVVIDGFCGICFQEKNQQPMPDKVSALTPAELLSIEIVKEFYGRLAGELSNKVKAAEMREQVLERKVTRLKALLKEHHQWHLEAGKVYFAEHGEVKCGPPTDLAEAYTESDFCTRTLEQLD